MNGLLWLCTTIRIIIIYYTTLIPFSWPVLQLEWQLLSFNYVLSSASVCDHPTDCCELVSQLQLCKCLLSSTMLRKWYCNDNEL